MNYLKNVAVVVLNLGLGLLMAMATAIFILESPLTIVLVLFVLGVTLAALGLLGGAIHDALIEIKQAVVNQSK